MPRRTESPERYVQQSAASAPGAPSLEFQPDRKLFQPRLWRETHLVLAHEFCLTEVHHGKRILRLTFSQQHTEIPANLNASQNQAWSSTIKTNFKLIIPLQVQDPNLRFLIPGSLTKCSILASRTRSWILGFNVRTEHQAAHEYKESRTRNRNRWRVQIHQWPAWSSLFCSLHDYTSR